MSYRIGGVEANKLYLGSTEAQRVYKGEQLIWEPPEAAPTFQSTDFTDAQGGISNWNPLWAASWSRAQVDAGSLGGKALEVTSGSGGLAWDTPGSLTNLEVLCKARQSAIMGGTKRSFGVGVRMGGAADARAGYVLRFESTGSYTIKRFDASAGTANTSVGAHSTLPLGNSLVFNIGDWYWFRLLIVGSELLGKVWTDGQAEPSAWIVGSTDTTFATAGSVGFHRPSGLNSHQLDYFAVSDGSTIPLPT